MESVKELFEKVSQTAMDICYLTNPIRKGWELHKLDEVNFELNDNPEFYNKYYLIECFQDTLTPEEYDILWAYGDGLYQKSFFDWLNGRTSLAEQLNTTMESWENKFKKHMVIFESVVEKRKAFIESNGHFL